MTHAFVLNFRNHVFVAILSATAFGQNAVQQNPAALQNSSSGELPTKTLAPEWYNSLGADHIQFLNDLLDHWQSKSSDVKRYQCDFIRFDYEPIVVNWRDPQTNRLAAASIMTGEIRFAAPDRACYQTTQVYDFEKPPEQPGQDPSYKPREESHQREKWICDGKAIYEFDYENKKLYETDIPPEMQGQGLINSPLPFLFGATKEDILNRFWVRVTTPNGVENEYWLEAYPKRIEDARNYKKLDLVLSRDELFLPIMIQIYAPNYNPKENKEVSRVFEFKNRRVNDKLTGIQNFLGWFVRPRLPMGFDRVKKNGLQPHQQFDPSKLQRPAQLPGKNPVR